MISPPDRIKGKSRSEQERTCNGFVKSTYYLLKGDHIVSSRETGTHWIFWPFIAIWRLVTWILEITGRLVAILLGVVFIIVGIVLSLTVVGAVLGIPLALFGFVLLLRGIF